MTTNDSRPHQRRGSRAVESEAETTRQDTTPPATFVTASRMSRDSAAGTIDSRLEGAIKQLSCVARQSDDEWLTVAIAELVADLERLWALEAGFEYVEGDAA